MTTSPLILPEHLNSLPVFPLPGVVFFPNTGLPLHIFEPRYQELVRTCLERDWPFAVVSLAPNAPPASSGRGPKLREVATAGLIVQSEPLTDGRSNILVGGVHRVRLLDEVVTDEPFRRFRAELLNDEPVEEPSAVPEHVSTLKNCLMSLQQQMNRAGREGAFPAALFNAEDPVVLAYVLSGPMLATPARCQEMLECTSLERRLLILIERAAELIAATAGTTQVH